MNKNIRKLAQLAQKKDRIILGLMSGTSFDGLDLALCRVTGAGPETSLELLHFETAEYTNELKTEIKTVFTRRDADLEKVCLLNAWIALRHAEMINAALKKWNRKKEDVDLIASHGQTIYHAPRFHHGLKKFPNATLQIGDGDHLAVHTGIITISDFRQKHIAAGGEGAPLAVYGDFLLFSKKGTDRILLNMGGIANYTFLSGTLDASRLFSTDVGPGNTMMDAYMQKSTGAYFDENATTASKGIVNKPLLNQLKSHPFFSLPVPKTTGPELFNLSYLQEAQNKSNTDHLSPEDILATLNRFTAETIAEALLNEISGISDAEIFASGGGIHNPLLMQHLNELLPGTRIQTTDALRVQPDAKEAVLFALLANECVAGDPGNYPFSGKGIPAVSMGKISFPE